MECGKNFDNKATKVPERAIAHFCLDLLENANQWFSKISVHIIGRGLDLDEIPRDSL
jgi:hypothetical protein